MEKKAYRNSPQRGEKYYKKENFTQKVQVTLDTVIPPMPTKEQRVVRPDRGSFENEYKILEKEIQILKNKKKDIIKNTQDHKDKEKKKKDKEAIRTTFNEAKEKFNTDRKAYKLAKNEIDEIRNRISTIQSQLENEGLSRIPYKSMDAFSKDIKKIQEALETSTLDKKTEKEYMKKLEDRSFFEESIPKFEKLSAELKTLKIAQKEKYGKYKELVDKQNKSFNEQQKAFELLNKNREESNKEFEEIKAGNPEVAALNKTIKEKEDQLYTIELKYYTEEDKFFEQQREIHKIEKMTKIKEMLTRRENERKIKEEEAKAMRELEEKEKENEEIEGLQALINFCLQYAPEKDKKEYNEEKTGKVNDNLQKLIGTGKLKEPPQKEKPQYLEKEANAKLSKNQKRRLKNQEKQIYNINLDPSSLSLFEKFKIVPPISVNDIPPKLDELYAKFQEIKKQKEVRSLEKKDALNEPVQIKNELPSKNEEDVKDPLIKKEEDNKKEEKNLEEKKDEQKEIVKVDIEENHKIEPADNEKPIDEQAKKQD